MLSCTLAQVLMQKFQGLEKVAYLFAVFNGNPIWKQQLRFLAK